MKHKEEEVKQHIRNLLGQQIMPVVSAKVISVQVQSKTCTVEFSDGFQLPNVRLKAAIDEVEECVILYPRALSEVLISPLTNDSTEYCVIKVNEVDSIETVIGENKCTINKDKVKVDIYPTTLEVTASKIILNQDDSKLQIIDQTITIDSRKKIVFKNYDTSLKTLLTSIVDLFSQIKVLTGGPGSLSPIDPSLMANFNSVKTEISKLLE